MALRAKSYEHLVTQVMRQFDLPRDEAAIYVSVAVDNLTTSGLPKRSVSVIDKAIVNATKVVMEQVKVIKLQAAELAASQIIKEPKP